MYENTGVVLNTCLDLPLGTVGHLLLPSGFYAFLPNAHFCLELNERLSNPLPDVSTFISYSNATNSSLRA